MRMDVLRWTIVTVNLVVWSPWLAVGILSGFASAAQNAFVALTLSAIGLALAIICARGRPRWELRAVVPVLALLAWVAVLYTEVSARSLHADSGCVICSLVDWRLRTTALLLGRGNYLMAFNVLWYDFVAPASILLSALLVFLRNASRLWASAHGDTAANAI
jgi:hypothetical protein